MPERHDNRWSLPRLSRRRALSLGAGAVAATVVTPTGPVAAIGFNDGRTEIPGSRHRSIAESIKPTIRPRADWGGELQVKGELVPEDDVRFLLVHHTASTNSYGPDQVIDQIRRFYDFHTGAEKGWPDIAYNFLVDRYGGIWEARAGSIDGPVRGDATGGSQGFALLCCSIGDHSLEPMSPEATDSMVRLLAWLGETYAVDTSPGATVSFTSRGSSRWAAGAEVTANTISGHRDMSTTTCPGDLAYNELAEAIPAAVTLVRTDAGSPPASSTDPTTATSAPAAAESVDEPTTVATPSTSTNVADPTIDPDAGDALADAGETGDDRSPALIGTGLVAGAIAAGGAVVARFWHRSDPA